MTRFLLALHLSLLCAPGVRESFAASTPDRPNIVLILCDDMGYSDLGCYGSEIQTPNLDALAANGVRSTQFYNTSKCWTTRATLLTGLYWQQAAPKKFLNDQCVTLPEVLKDHGYRTYMSGKWHLSPGHYRDKSVLPTSRGFEKYFGTLHGAGSFFDPHTLTRGFEPIKAPKGFYYTDAISDDAAGNIRDCLKESPDKPFFMYVAYTAPHWPMHALPEDIAKYRGVYSAGWDKLRKRRFERMKRLGVIPANAQLSPPNPKAKQWSEVDRDWEAQRMAVYAAMIDRMDQGVGRIVQALKDSDAFENTLILFMSDNGASPENIGVKNGVNCLGGKAETRAGRKIQVGYGPGVDPGPETTFQGYGPSWANASCSPFRWWKATSHEGGTASPFIAHWPKGIRNPGSIQHEFGHLIDLMPTCLEAAGARYPSKRKNASIPPMEGASLFASITSNTPMPHRVVFNEFGRKASVRDGDWKLVCLNVTKRDWELYNLKADPGELIDLIESEPARVKRMDRQFTDWQKRIGGQFSDISAKPTNNTKPKK